MDITRGKLTKRKKFRLLLLRKLKRANHRYEFPRFSGEMDRLPNLFSSFQAQRGLCHDRSYFFFASETVRSAVVTGTFVYVPTAVVSKVGNDSLVMVPLVRPVLGIQCLRRQVFD